jgi:hypothetical protein
MDTPTKSANELFGNQLELAKRFKEQKRLRKLEKNRAEKARAKMRLLEQNKI